MRKYDWKEIQEYYNDNHSWADLTEKFGCCACVIASAIKRGEFISRTHKESQEKLPNTWVGRKHTEATKEKISKHRIQYLQDNPDKVPYKMFHYSKGVSFAEQYFIDLFEKEGIPLKYHLGVGIYELDFYDEEKRFDLEIDGEQHYKDKRIVESDIRKTNYLVERGWKVYRIRWSEWQKFTDQEKKEKIQMIKEMMK